MAITTLTAYSNEGEVIAGVADDLTPLPPNKSGGRVRIQRFSKTFASEASGTNFGLCLLPAGARILGGEFQFSASLGGVTTWSLGLKGYDESGFIDLADTVSDAVAALFAAIALTSTAKQVIAATQALKFGYQTEKQLWVTATTAAGSMGTQVLEGYILYVLD